MMLNAKPWDKRLSGDQSMGCASKKLINYTMFLLFLFCLIIGCSEFSINPRMFSSYIDYDLQIKTSEPISNATFYIPLPVKNNTPMIGTLPLEEQQFEKNHYSVAFIQHPPGIEMSGAYPVWDNQPWFLKITVSRIDPGQLEKPGYSIEIENITSLKSPLLFSNSLFPIGNESVFLPKINFSLMDPVRTSLGSQYWIKYSPIAVQQKIPLFADYSASQSTKVEIFSSIHSSNSWKEKYDESGSNSYNDRYSWYHYGESRGWQTAQGIYEAAQGIYPNLDHPVWQQVMNGTTT